MLRKIVQNSKMAEKSFKIVANNGKNFTTYKNYKESVWI